MIFSFYAWVIARLCIVYYLNNLLQWARRYAGPDNRLTNGISNGCLMSSSTARVIRFHVTQPKKDDDSPSSVLLLPSPLCLRNASFEVCIPKLLWRMFLADEFTSITGRNNGQDGASSHLRHRISLMRTETGTSHQLSNDKQSAPLSRRANPQTASSKSQDVSPVQPPSTEVNKTRRPEIKLVRRYSSILDTGQTA